MLYVKLLALGLCCINGSWLPDVLEHALQLRGATTIMLGFTAVQTDARLLTALCVL